VEEASKQLRAAEEALTAFRQKTGLITRIEDQGRVIIETITGLRVQIMMREAQVAGMRSYATDSNPALVHALKELANLRRELATLEKTRPLGQGNILLPTGDVPEVAQDYVVKVRDVRYQELMLEALARQLEQAKIDEGKNPTTIQAVDRAVVPDKKTRPKRSLIVIFSVLFGFILGSVGALLNEWRIRAATDPKTAERLELLMSYLRFRAKHP
jgi:tyrosine-protein kinase Etk/Wzc